MSTASRRRYAGQEQARWDPGSLRHCPAACAAAGNRRQMMDSLRETVFCRPHAPVPPVAPNVLAPGRLRSSGALAERLGAACTRHSLKTR
jgi:hypothetical protein